jgi:hypothetical protein
LRVHCAPTAEAPFAGNGDRFDEAPQDRNGADRGDETTPGPVEFP